MAALAAMQSSNGTGGLFLPPLPDAGDAAALCQWCTVTFALDRGHPITGGRREGEHGTSSVVVLERLEAPEIRLDPFTRVCTPARLHEALVACAIATDGTTPRFKTEHCTAIATAVRRLADARAARTAAERADRIITAAIEDADGIHGHTTYAETSGQRYEAAVALRRPLDESTGRPFGRERYLIDSQTGEHVIRVSTLELVANRALGSSLRRGELDSLMAAVGWQHVTIDGHQLPGRAGRQGPHARCKAWRGHLPGGDEPDAEEGDQVPAALDERERSRDHVTARFPMEYARARGPRARREVVTGGHRLLEELSDDELVAAFPGAVLEQLETTPARELAPKWTPADRMLDHAEAAELLGLTSRQLTSRVARGEVRLWVDSGARHGRGGRWYRAGDLELEVADPARTLAENRRRTATAVEQPAEQPPVTGPSCACGHPRSAHGGGPCLAQVDGRGGWTAPHGSVCPCGGWEAAS
jgi:hypothetical protein